MIGEHNPPLSILQCRGGLAIDLTREPVDGSGDSTGKLDNYLWAARELARIQEFLGIRDYRIARFMILKDADAYQKPVTRWNLRQTWPKVPSDVLGFGLGD